MNAQEALDEILPIIYSVKEDEHKLQRILKFLNSEICEEPGRNDEIEIPEKYKKIVSEIANSIDAGFVCYLNADTLELEEIPKELADDPEEFEAMTGESFESMNFKCPGWENCITFEPLESHESFKVMRKFAESLEDTGFQEKLFVVLNNPNPFANFKLNIDNSIYRQDLFDFKKSWLEACVKELLVVELNGKEDQLHPKEVNGLYEENENEINPESVPVSSVCMSCKIHWIDNKEENLLCRIKRFEHRNDKDFRCDAFESV